MTDLAVIEARLPDTSDRLDDLARTINEKNREVSVAVSVALTRAIEAGEALNEAFGLVEPGQWRRWCDTNLDINETTAAAYRRLAVYKHLLPESITHADYDKNGRVHGVSHAIAYLKQINAPDQRQRGRRAVLDRDEVQRLRQNGMSTSELAELFGVSNTTVRNALESNEKALARRRRYQKEYRARARALRREQAAKAAAATSQDLAEAYSLLRKCLQRTQVVRDACPDKTQRKHLDAVLLRLAAAEDFLTKASKERA